MLPIREPAGSPDLHRQSSDRHKRVGELRPVHSAHRAMADASLPQSPSAQFCSAAPLGKLDFCHGLTMGAGFHNRLTRSCKLSGGHLSQISVTLGGVGRRQGRCGSWSAALVATQPLRRPPRARGGEPGCPPDRQGMGSPQITPFLATSATHRQAQEQGVEEVRGSEAGVSQSGRTAEAAIHDLGSNTGIREIVLHRYGTVDLPELET